MKEIVVISGKGGTGKTSLAASFALLSRGAVIADCDVDAADMHLLLQPSVTGRWRFQSGNEAIIRPEACTGCGRCEELCRFGAVRDRGGIRAVDPSGCEGCGVCARFCPAGAIDFPVRDCGEWMISSTRAGTMVHARLAPGAENSGRLVSTVRREAARLAAEEGAGLILVDGPPGIGCPVIASMTGASLALAVTEPTLSGAHDLERVISLASHFGIPVAVCINKWDINPPAAEEIERRAVAAGAATAGRITYDPVFTESMIRGSTVVETGGRAADEIALVWDGVRSIGGFDDR